MGVLPSRAATSGEVAPQPRRRVDGARGRAFACRVTDQERETAPGK